MRHWTHVVVVVVVQDASLFICPLVQVVNATYVCTYTLGSLIFLLRLPTSLSLEVVVNSFSLHNPFFSFPPLSLYPLPDSVGLRVSGVCFLLPQGEKMRV